MPKSFEEELQNFQGIIQRLSSLALAPKKLIVKGAGNFVLKGPNIIVGNHVGSYKMWLSCLRLFPGQFSLQLIK